MLKAIIEYFERTTQYKPLRFILEMYLLALFSKIIVICSILLIITLFESTEPLFFGDNSEDTIQFNELSWLESLFILCLILPFTETLFGQALPIYITNIFSRKNVFSIIISASFFSYLHSYIGVIFIMIIFFAGCIYAWCFIVYKKKSFIKAVIITTSVHSLYNFTVFATFYLFA